MKKFAFAAAAALAVTSAAPAFADTNVSDDPFVSTQASLEAAGSLGLGGAGAIIGGILIIGVIAAGDS
ncbi:hypothetical protein [Thalassovita sp.]|uniref:hypothetical protein n=1 Tax=Thalassovita sp. TaxID=1979401 RepID=UPI0029DE7504|nr:hypothetical protein [Thalassovita sp.]